MLHASTQTMQDVNRGSHGLSPSCACGVSWGRSHSGDQQQCTCLAIEREFAKCALERSPDTSAHESGSQFFHCWGEKVEGEKASGDPSDFVDRASNQAGSPEAEASRR